MKTCTWCGKEHPDEAERCSIDQFPLESKKPEPPQAAPASTAGLDHAPVWQPRLLDLAQLENAFVHAEGYSRPNWKLLRQIIKQQISPVELSEAWMEVATQWLEQLRSAAGNQAATAGGMNPFVIEIRYVLVVIIVIAEQQDDMRTVAGSPGRALKQSVNLVQRLLGEPQQVA